MRVAMLAVIVVSASTTAARMSPGARVYTLAQAEAGRVAIAQNSFGDCRACHTSTLTGRTGAAGELPSIASLSEDYQKLVNGNGGRVPPLVGAEFVSRWSRRSTKRLVEEFDKRFSPPLSVDTRLAIIAYMLQASGAPAGADPLTPTTDVPITSVFTGDEATHK
jgi:hypothetical protein